MTHPQTQDDEALVILAKRFALCHIDADNVAYESSGLTIDDWVETNWRHFLPEARSAMVALRKHDEERVAAVVEAIGDAVMDQGIWLSESVKKVAATAALTALRDHEGRKG